MQLSLDDSLPVEYRTVCVLRTKQLLPGRLTWMRKHDILTHFAALFDFGKVSRNGNKNLSISAIPLCALSYRFIALDCAIKQYNAIVINPYVESHLFLQPAPPNPHGFDKKSMGKMEESQIAMAKNIARR